MTKEQKDKVLYSFVFPLVVALVVVFIGIGSTKVDDRSSEIELLKINKADKCDLEKKVDVDIFNQHLTNESANFKLLLEEIRLNRKAINQK